MDAVTARAGAESGERAEAELVARSGLTARRVLATLSLLEFEGLAVQSSGVRFARMV